MPEDRLNSRRAFLATAAAAASAMTARAEKNIKPGITAKSASRTLGANDRIRVGMIGVGIMGTGHLRAFARQAEADKDIEITAISDVYKRHRERAQAISKIDAKNIVVDYRDVLKRDDVDCVLIATPDHWHAQMAIDAFAAGKDVYLQKPITLTVDESAQVIAAAAKYKRVLQVGSQFLSDARWHKVKELIGEGAIGEVLWGQTTYSRNSIVGEWNYYVDEEATPENIDWTRWLGSAKKRPFSAERFFRWRKYWEYSNGIASDLFYHRVGPMLFAMGAQFPTRVSGAGGIYVQKDREVPDTLGIMAEYGKFMIVVAGSMANMSANKYLPEVVYGHSGTILVENDKVTVTPERIAKALNRPTEVKTFDFPTAVRDMARRHSDNFFSCMRTRQTPVLGPELAHQIMVSVMLGCESWRTGEMKLFDPSTQKRGKKAATREGFEGDGKNNPGGPRKEPSV
ncbi:Gfo/Idh/MocA family protein [Paludibaculum fermentans]|uniref:Gfo/Idh/MocA family oxidoreductase n=1 Tax=Paludibaculum fermentans TaxID=1473598 RepID=A0A7S7SHM8_PALFE|nr:Gfo/Idh/MocA family oxidoreductase [Paludibaculum fermentans]QOY86092.1 Gfo/Idh/MocA family oxidoreductase [Paludibaculum fermentans]